VRNGFMLRVPDRESGPPKIVVCPECKSMIDVRPNQATVKCPTCRKTIRIATPTYQRGTP
jgi:uncharacterized CHY-type Zn-finger protein